MRRVPLVVGVAVALAGCGSAFTATDGDAGKGSDASPDATDSGTDGGSEAGVSFTCGVAQCTAPAETCCVSNGGSNASCVPGLVCNNAGALALHCASQAQCPGQVCCFHQVNGGGVSDCRPACNQGDLELCSPVEMQSCPMGQTCNTNPGGGVDFPAGVGACQQ